jgi:hypothetical protein
MKGAESLAPLLPLNAGVKVGASSIFSAPEYLASGITYGEKLLRVPEATESKGS